MNASRIKIEEAILRLEEAKNFAVTDDGQWLAIENMIYELKKMIKEKDFY